MATFQYPLAGLGEQAPSLTSLLTARREREKKSKLADLLANAYGSQDDAQRQQYVQEAIRTDPQAGMGLAKLLDPRLRGAGDKPAQQQYAEWLLTQVPADQRDQVLGVLGGYKPRPSGAAIQYKQVVGADGITRSVAFDPREVGAQVIGSGETFGSGVGGGVAPQPSMPEPSIGPPGGDMFAGLGQIPGVQVTSGLRTPEHNAKVGGVANSYHLTNQARDIVPPRTPEQAQQVRQFAAQNGLEIIDEGDHWHMEPRSRNAQPQRGGADPFQSRPQEQQKFLDEAAQQQAQLSALPLRGQIEAVNAGATERAKQQAQLETLPALGRVQADNEALKAGAQAAATARADLPKVQRNANVMLQTINSLKTDPALKSIVGLNGTFNPKVYIPGTPEQRALTKVKQIQGQTFLQAYNTLKGGGQITEVEGAKAEAAMARLSRAQSYEDYLSALSELEQVIQGAVESAQSMASGGQQSQASGPKVRKFNPATGRLE